MGIENDKGKQLWTEIIIPQYSYKPRSCPTCFVEEFVLEETDGEDILNPYYLRCYKTM